MKSSLSGLFNLRIERPKVGIASKIWKVGLFLSLIGVAAILIAGIPALLGVINQGFGYEPSRLNRWWVLFGMGWMMGGVNVSLVSYLISGLQKNPKS